MAQQANKITIMVHKVFTQGYWDSDHAVRYAPMLFAFLTPESRVRDALRALSCKKDKDSRYRLSQSSIESQRSTHDAFREFEYILEKYESRYRKRSLESDGRDMRDMVMMLMPTLMTQKSTVSVSLDVNALTDNIYKECESCPIREICKEAFPVCTEYITVALNAIGVPEPTNE